MTTRVLYPGSFDPVHNGHIEIISTAAELFDEVVVAAMRNPQKGGGSFSLDEREEMISEATAHLPNVSITMFSSVCSLSRRPKSYPSARLSTAIASMRRSATASTGR